MENENMNNIFYISLSSKTVSEDQSEIEIENFVKNLLYVNQIYSLCLILVMLKTYLGWVGFSP